MVRCQTYPLAALGDQHNYFFFYSRNDIHHPDVLSRYGQYFISGTNRINSFLLPVRHADKGFLSKTPAVLIILLLSFFRVHFSYSFKFNEVSLFNNLHGTFSQFGGSASYILCHCCAPFNLQYLSANKNKTFTKVRKKHCFANFNCFYCLNHHYD